MILPSFIYNECVKNGQLQKDEAQQKTVGLLDQLCKKLAYYRPAESSAGLLGTITNIWKKPVEVPKGLYLVGPVGRGKSMLMDLFYNQVPVQHKQRVHFHYFMQNTYKRFHELKKLYPKGGDPVPQLAKEISKNAWLLCFDEFQVNDIADAVLLGRLFQNLFACGVVVVATSNVNLRNLFQNRPGADAFKPFIKILQQNLQEVELFATRDYRTGRPEDEKRWLFPINEENRAILDHVFLRESKGKPVKPSALQVMGRSFIIDETADDVARISFEKLCGSALGAGDYLALAQRFRVLIIDDIVKFNAENLDMIQRFTNLIDVLYEQHVKLYVSAESNYEFLYDQKDRKAFFERTISRLNEMQSQDWAEK